MIHLREISKTFGDFTAVDNVSCSIGRGMVYGLLGSNGAGKTTLIKMMCGILRPTSGSGQILGYNIKQNKDQIRQRIGYMSQKFSLYDDLSVYENLLFYIKLYGVPRPDTRARELLYQFGIESMQDKMVYSLSSGVRQRVAFACALAHSPELLFLDEPTSGVDPMSRRLIWDWLYELSANGMTIVVTTHYMDEAEHCDRIALMNAGRFVVEGTITELRTRFAHLSTSHRPTLEDIFVHLIKGK